MKVKALVRVLLVMLISFACSGLAFAQSEPPAVPPPNGSQIENHLKKLVDKGTITSDQSQKILELFKSKAAEHKPGAQRPDGPPPDGKGPDIVQDLVKAAGLSEEQAKVVAEELRPPKPPTDNQNR